MVMNMTTQNYCMVNKSTNICENVCVWDGNPDSWTPPAEYLMLVQATTPAKIWMWNADTKTWDLTEQMGVGGIGFIWDGIYLITSAPQPAPIADPNVTGAQTL